jgi:hypothetical protein
MPASNKVLRQAQGYFSIIEAGKIAGRRLDDLLQAGILPRPTHQWHESVRRYYTEDEVQQLKRMLDENDLPIRPTIAETAAAHRKAKNLWTMKEICEAANRSVTTFQYHRNLGRIAEPDVRFGSVAFYSADAAERIIKFLLEYDGVKGNRERESRPVSAFGECKTLSEWSRDPRCAVDFNTLHRRVNYGWDIEEAITKEADQSYLSNRERRGA